MIMTLTPASVARQDGGSTNDHQNDRRSERTDLRVRAATPEEADDLVATHPDHQGRRVASPPQLRALA